MSRWQLKCAGTRSASDFFWSADFPVRSNAGVFQGFEKFYIFVFFTLLRTGKSALQSRSLYGRARKLWTRESRSTARTNFGITPSQALRSVRQLGWFG